MRISVKRTYKKEPNILEQESTVTEKKNLLERFNSRWEQAEERIGKLKVRIEIIQLEVRKKNEHNGQKQ